MLLTFPFSVLSTKAIILGKTDRHIINVINTTKIHTQILLMMYNVLVVVESSRFSVSIRGLISEIIIGVSYVLSS